MADPVSLRTNPQAGDFYHGYIDAPPAAARRRGPALHIALFAATFLTTATASAFYQGKDFLADPAQLLFGFPYAIAIMTILLFHECGHYFLARAHHVDASLPYFIPAPPVPFFIGTLGAFIRMRSMPRDRRALFDVGAAGPWAGIAVALPILALGLQLSEVRPADPGAAGGGLFLGESMLFKAVSWMVLGVSGSDVTVVLHPVALAGWVGLLVTALNLLPIGQLDGGHVVYAAFGEYWHRWIARGTLTTLIVLGLGGAFTWLVWAVLLSAIGLRHPNLVDADTPLDRPRTWAALATIVLFLVTFMPEPFYSSDPPAPPILRDEHAVPVGAPAPADWVIPL
ncbi:MAG: site-2 protease family protein [Candidatus Binatia bacterium]